ncbi:MAG: hypothetical protein KBS83_05275, partial [Lachnospiraceae bacterium]|nr:hypothetical protein [Candidatus Equihabitans merdae]
MTDKKRLPDAKMPSPGFEKYLISWFENNKRKLPWRTTSDANHIWVSEIMLQQTKIAAVIENFKRYMEELPTLESQAACP